MKLSGKRNNNMLKGQNEVRMIWLMVLIIVAVGAWFLDVRLLTYLCAIAFVKSVMQYVDVIQKPLDEISAQTQFQAQTTSRVPLYVASITAVVGGVLHVSWLVGLGVTVWIYFFLRWLRRLENHLNQVQQLQLQLAKFDPSTNTTLSAVSLAKSAKPIDLLARENNQKVNDEIGLMDQLRQWLFQGNPVLKVAILVLIIGIILLLRFATEHWQLSLILKLVIVAGVSGAITALGYRLKNKNRSFALALEGLGLSGLFLTLFFAYYNDVIPNLLIASVCFALIITVTIVLSLRQQSIELALMALIIAAVAPFTLPVREITAVELLFYYLVINLAVAFLSTLRPWKILNQIAFIMTCIIGGGYAFLYGYTQEKNALAILVCAHTLVFVWLSFRFSQLIAQHDFEQFKIKPALDIALIFSAPIIGYIFLYLMYFQESIIQASLSLGFSVLYIVLYLLAKRNHFVELISQSYLSLALIFMSLIPPILLPDQWSVAGWAIEGLIIFVYALYQGSNISRYLAMGLLLVAGLSSLYYLVESIDFPQQMFWGLCCSYWAVVVAANSREIFRNQLTASTITFLSLLTLSANSMLLILLMDYFEGVNKYALTLLSICCAYVLVNELMLWRKATGSWHIPKWVGAFPILLFAFILLGERGNVGFIQWHTQFERWGFAFSALMLTIFWLRPLTNIRFEKEWVSLGALVSLSFISLTLIPNMPFISVVIMPLIFCAWCYWQTMNTDWTLFWQTRTSLSLMIVWIICSQIFSQQAFESYILPIVNPFDLVSLAMLSGFIWMLSLQIKESIDKGIVAILAVLSLLWLSSYIVLRALHFYFGTPYNDVAIWQDATVQLSLTLLWVSLAFICMSLASRRQLRPIWILGGSILVIVTLKLVLFDLSHIGTLTRVISFLGAGFIMLIIAYIAPIPDVEIKS